MNRDVQVDASTLMSDLKLKVVLTGVWKMNARIWVATKLFALAGWVLGANMTVDTEEEQDPQ